MMSETWLKFWRAAAFVPCYKLRYKFMLVICFNIRRLAEGIIHGSCYSLWIHCIDFYAVSGIFATRGLGSLSIFLGQVTRYLSELYSYQHE